jgi:hypothetical protein
LQLFYAESALEHAGAGCPANRSATDAESNMAGSLSASRNFEAYRKGSTWMLDAMQQSLVSFKHNEVLKAQSPILAAMTSSFRDFDRAALIASDAAMVTADKGVVLPASAIPKNAETYMNYKIFSSKLGELSSQTYGKTYVVDASNRVFASFDFHLGAKGERVYHFSEKPKAGESSHDRIIGTVNSMINGESFWSSSQDSMRRGFLAGSESPKNQFEQA